MELVIWRHGEEPACQVIPIDLLGAQSLSAGISRGVLFAMQAEVRRQSSTGDIS
jgi:hypothetical protein